MINKKQTYERSSDGHERDLVSVDDNTCPECQGQITQDGDQGEVTCESCGLVFEESRVDHGPEWRAFTSDERDEKSRVGAPTTKLMHDKGLSTTIGWQDKDAYGQAVSGRKRAQLQRLRTWDERFRTKDSRDRNLKQALGEISRMASALGLPEPVQETAGVLYRRAIEEDLLPGRSIEGMSTASLYAATRQHGMPRTLTEFGDVSRVEKLRFQRAYRYLSRELGLKIEPENPTRYLPQFASSLDVSDEAERRSRELLEVATNNAVHSGKSPAGLAAAALYAASHLTNEQLTQETVSEVASVSQVTIRNRYQELLEVYKEND
ncbi:transcription initiation factor IIB 2 (plasmid) [Halobaculum sp. CBA1158]|uniref:transcription initiation factor IIB n=1 Tax=Halobaculum sp. CBA1158 TaxID=2904243 RepID=UPI001F1D26A0|nr:TFIIB-type zinc ribbon-containing protein [Halobaculum sp. CBA1158]UIP01694.1 transcription initiation factor IIB 2 [Halobaculum sp. CBA1158]